MRKYRASGSVAFSTILVLAVSVVGCQPESSTIPDPPKVPPAGGTSSSEPVQPPSPDSSEDALKMESDLIEIERTIEGETNKLQDAINRGDENASNIYRIANCGGIIPEVQEMSQKLIAEGHLPAENPMLTRIDSKLEALYALSRCNS
jgi:hypothetical protein